MNEFTKLYRAILANLLDEGELAESRSGNMVELIGKANTFTDPASVVTGIPNWRDFNFTFAGSLAEAIWCGDSNGQNLSGVSERSRQFLQIPEHLADSVCAMYGPKLLASLPFVKHCIDKEENTRRAISHFNTPGDVRIVLDECLAKLEFPCTLAWQWLPRNGKLHMHVHMRSQCAFTILPLDLYVQNYILAKLSAELGLQQGCITQSYGSIHIYEKDIVKLAKSGDELLQPKAERRLAL